MRTMKRQMISFSEPQDKYLIEQAEKLGISVSELVRRIVDWYQDTYPLTAKVEVKQDDGK